MELTWFGRYREITAALIHFSNCMDRSAVTRGDIGDGVMLTSQEWQVLEAIVEYNDENYIMSDISSHLGIPQSTLSKITKLLTSYDLVEKFQFKGNKKNIVLKPTEKGIRLYFSYCENSVTPLFHKLFDELEPLTNEQLAVVTKAVTALSKGLISGLKQEQDTKLIKLD